MIIDDNMIPLRPVSLFIPVSPESERRSQDQNSLVQAR